MRRECKTVNDVDDIKSDQIEKTFEFFCEEKVYIPTFSDTEPTKTHGAPTVTANPLVLDEIDLRAGLNQFLKYIFLNYLGKFWTLSVALKDISTSNLPWFLPGTGIRRIVSFYRNLVPTSA